MPIILPPASEVLAGPTPDHEERYADDPTALTSAAPPAPAQDDWPLGLEGEVDSAASAEIEPQLVEPPAPAACTIPVRVRDLRIRVRLTGAAWESAKESAKEAKKEHQAALADLMRALDASGAASADSVRDEPPATATTADAEAWRRFELAGLDLSPAIVQTLADNDLTTMGQLCDFTAGGGLLTDLKKIGRGKAEKIEDACERFWAEHPEFGEGAGGEEPVDES